MLTLVGLYFSLASIKPKQSCWLLTEEGVSFQTSKQTFHTGPCLSQLDLSL